MKQKVKLKTTDYVELKNKLKFLEFYWSQLDESDYESIDYQQKEQIEAFIALDLYQAIRTLKQHTITKKVTVSRRTFNLLNEYGPISDKLKQIWVQHAHKITPDHDII